MIKQLTFLILSILVASLSSCGKDDDEGCRESGALSATWSDGQALKFNYNIYTDEAGDKFGIQSTADVEFCAPRVSLSVTDISAAVGRYNLVRYNRDGIFIEGSVWVRTMDNDALTETYLLDTLKTHWIEVNEVGDNRIKGVITATFALEEETVNKAWNFPDTLQFKQEMFELVKRQ